MWLNDWTRRKRRSPIIFASVSAHFMARALMPRRTCSETATVRPLRAAASMMRLEALIVMPHGFSIMTCMPASRHGMAVVWWKACGVQLSTASAAPLFARSSAPSKCAGVQPSMSLTFAAKASRRSLELSQSATISKRS